MKDLRENSAFRVLAAAAALAAIAGSAIAQAVPNQETGPVVIGENRGKYKFFELQHFTAEAEVYGEFHNDSQTVDGQPTQRVRENILRADTKFSFQSAIGHKNLIDLSGTFRLGIEDHTITTTNPNSTTRERPLVDFYNIEALILGEGPAPTTIYSRRDQTITSRDFTTSLTNTISETGAIVSLESDVAPTRLQAFHRELNQTDSLTINDNSTQDTFSLQSGIKLSERQRMEVNYEFDHINETQSNVFQDTYDRNDGSITHNLDFGAERQNNLRSYLRIYDQTGQFSQTDNRWDEQLQLRHSDTLDTRYNFTVDKQKYAGTEQQIVSGDASLHHRLFESLVTTLHVGDNYLSNPGIFDSNEVFATALFDYTKKVPYGHINASMGFGIDQIVSSNRGGDTFIINEPHTFIDPLPVVLNHQNIIPSSIVMTNQPRTYTFIQGSDYTVNTLPSFTELFRNLVGPNPPANGQTVLVNYEIGPQPGSTLNTFSQNYSARYTVDQGWLTGLSPYIFYLQTNQSISAADPSAFVLDDVQDIRYGLDYTIGGFFFEAEHRNHNSTVQPYDQNKALARYSRSLGRDSNLSLEVSADQVQYRFTGQQLGANYAMGRWTQRLNEQLDFSAYLQYQANRDSFAGNVNGFQQALEVRWHYGQTSAFVTVRNGTLNGQGTSKQSQLLTVGLSRAF